MEILLFLLGVLGGVFAGLIPGIGVFTTLILLYPLLLDLTIIQLLILYIPIISISQYIGSVPALYFKIPGEATSFIATEYGHDLFKKGNYDLIPLTAIGSFVATVMSATGAYADLRPLVHIGSHGQSSNCSVSTTEIVDYSQ